jgi:hypothetical protein
MGKIADVTLKGQSSSYQFEAYPIDATFNAVGAVYVFTKRTVDPSGSGSHTPIYIGQTDSLADRIPNHEKWPCIKRENANCICVQLDDSERSRLQKEADLITAYHPPCNE